METVAEFSGMSPYKTTILGGNVGAKLAKSMKVEPELSSSSERLISEATRGVRELSLYEIEYDKNRRHMSFVALGWLHELRAAAAMDPALMEGLEKKSKLPRRKDTSDHLYVVKAVLKLAGSELKPQTASDWAKVLRGLELADVRPDSLHVVEWLGAPEDGTGLTGHAKAFAFVERALKAGPHAAAAEARAAKKAEERKQAWNAYVTPKLEAPLAEITFAEPVTATGGYVLQLARIEGHQAKVIDIVVTDEDEVQRLVRKHRIAA